MKKNIDDLLKKRKNKLENHIVFCNDIEIIIDEICSKMNLPRIEVKRIIDAQFRILREIMRNEGLIKTDSNFEDFKSIRLPRLGSFRPSEKKFYYMQKYLKEKKDV